MMRKGIGEKAAYVKRQKQNRRHACHWPGCPKQVPPAMWGCKPHWYTLPLSIRDDIWKAYRSGQENDMKPSIEYRLAALAAQAWIIQYKEKPRHQFCNICGSEKVQCGAIGDITRYWVGCPNDNCLYFGK